MEKAARTDCICVRTEDMNSFSLADCLIIKSLSTMLSVSSFMNSDRTHLAPFRNPQGESAVSLESLLLWLLPPLSAGVCIGWAIPDRGVSHPMGKVPGHPLLGAHRSDPQTSLSPLTFTVTSDLGLLPVVPSLTPHLFLPSLAQVLGDPHCLIYKFSAAWTLVPQDPSPAPSWLVSWGEWGHKSSFLISSAGQELGVDLSWGPPWRRGWCVQRQD